MSQMLIARTADPATSVTQAEAAAMLRAVVNLLRLWKVNDIQARVLLGQPSPSTFYRWKRGEIGAVPHLFTEPERGYAWMSRPNTAFGGKSALDRMLAGAPSDLTAVRNYLDAERGGW